MKLNESFSLGALKLRNRIVMPPMVTFGQSNDRGLVTDAHVRHYAARAESCGLIVVEATCILPDGRLSMDQLGIWNDDQIPGLKRIADACHDVGCPVLLQIHHAGMSTVPAAGQRVGPSACEYRGTAVHELTEQEILHIIDCFVLAAVRARKAGFDGVELHACHNYLIDQFLNPLTNRRTDHWGGSLENRTRLLREIVKEIRGALPSDFTVTARLAANIPTIKEGQQAAVLLCGSGLDALNISHSINRDFDLPQDYPYGPVSYLGCAIATELQARLPVMAVGGIDNPDIAEDILKNRGPDLVCVGHGLLADPDWAGSAISGKPLTSPCLRCPNCGWPARCPRVLKRNGLL